ncbi:MAG: DUF1178 family protein [Pseudomonadota bacterium]
MIKYTLKCTHGHQFDSWFASAAAFDTLAAGGHLTCAVCGSAEVEKSIMAPRVRAARDAEAAPAVPEDAQSKAFKAIRAMKDHVEKNSDYVGKDFATQARAMHDGDAPERPIWGEAKPAEAKRLIDDGVPVLPLPFTPKSKAN